MWAISLLCLVPLGDVLVDEVDVIEKNYVWGNWDENGKPVQTLAQWIFWEWSEERQRFQVVGWKIIRKGEMVEADSKCWKLRFTEGSKTREIRSVSYRETHSHSDLEVDDRSIWPVEKRRKLRSK